MLKNLILSAAAAGVAAGLLTAVVQHVTTTPLILEAEKYETGEAANAAVKWRDEPGVVTATHGHEAEAWSPADGIERTLTTSLATTVLGVGFSLALLGCMVLAGGEITARSGLAFGAAGFAAVALAPALGLPPEIPGSGAAALEVRQIWWAFAVVATAAGIGMLLLGGHVGLWIAGVALIVAPHIVGAPHPQTYESTAPAELAGHFAAASLVVSAVFWALLGSASGAVYRRLSAS